MRRLCLLLPVISLVATGTLAACRTESAVAAYVGDLIVSTEQLAAAVDERMNDDNIAAVVEPGEAGYQRTVLGQLIQQAIYRILSVDYDITITDQEVENKLDELLADDVEDVEATYARLAAEQRLSALDVRENVRQALTREAIAAEENLDGPIQEPALRQRYEEIKNQLSRIELGFITVPDQQTATATLASLLADPNSYAAVAATFTGPFTQPAVVSSTLAEVPAELIPSVLQTVVGQGFTVAVPRTGGIVVGYVASLDMPTFEDVRDQVRVEAASVVDATVGEIVTEFVSGLDIDINPRYGSLDQGQVVPDTDGGVVRILEDVGTP